MFTCILCALLAVAVAQDTEVQSELTVTLELVEWRKTKDIAAMGRPDCIPMDAQTLMKIEVDAALGKPFSTTTTADGKKYHLSGEVTLRPGGEYGLHVHASMVEPVPFPINIGDGQKVVINNVRAVTSSITLKLGERAVPAGHCGSRDGSAFCVSISKKGRPDD